MIGRVANVGAMLVPPGLCLSLSLTPLFSLFFLPLLQLHGWTVLMKAWSDPCLFLDIHYSVMSTTTMMTHFCIFFVCWILAVFFSALWFDRLSSFDLLFLLFLLVFVAAALLNRPAPCLFLGICLFLCLWLWAEQQLTLGFVLVIFTDWPRKAVHYPSDPWLPMPSLVMQHSELWEEFVDIQTCTHT